jgi:hypothetical protein
MERLFGGRGEEEEEEGLGDSFGEIGPKSPYFEGKKELNLPYRFTFCKSQVYSKGVEKQFYSTFALFFNL